MSGMTLDEFLGSGAVGNGTHQRVAEVVRQLALAALTVRATINQGAVASFTNELASRNVGGDTQTSTRRLRRRGFSRSGSNRRGRSLLLRGARHRRRYRSRFRHCGCHRSARRLVEHRHQCLDRHDLLDPAGGRRCRHDPEATFLQPGRNQLAAGFFIYGPQLALALTPGQRHARLRLHSPYRCLRRRLCRLHHPVRAPGVCDQRLELPPLGRGGAPLHRRLPERPKGSARRRTSTCAGSPRWSPTPTASSCAAACFSIRGDDRKGYGRGRLRLVYEANPIALLIEQAGGAATDGV